MCTSWFFLWPKKSNSWWAIWYGPRKTYNNNSSQHCLNLQLGDTNICAKLSFHWGGMKGDTNEKEKQFPLIPIPSTYTFVFVTWCCLNPHKISSTIESRFAVLWRHSRMMHFLCFPFNIQLTLKLSKYLILTLLQSINPVNLKWTMWVETPRCTSWDGMGIRCSIRIPNFVASFPSWLELWPLLLWTWEENTAPLRQLHWQPSTIISKWNLMVMALHGNHLNCK